MDISQHVKVRAEDVRRAIMTAQGHHSAVADSAEFISDELLVLLAEKVFNERGIKSLDRRPGDPSNPFVQQACPGVLLFQKYNFG